MIVERPTYIQQITPFIGKNVIKVLTGVRRSGKSTLLDLIRPVLVSHGADEGNILHLRFESERYADIRTSNDLVDYVASHVDTTRPVTLLFDEIQEVDHWEKAVRSFMVDYNADMYITGSNAYVLSSDLATFITGRYVTINVFPLSFKEFLAALRDDEPQVDPHVAFRRYVEQGGFPFQTELEFDQSSSLKYLEDLFSTILLKDVVKRNNIRDVDLLERIVRYAIREEGHLITPKSIADYLKSERRSTSPETVANYLNAAEQAYLIYRAPRQDLIGKRILQFNEKYYVVDQGLRQAIGMNNTAGIDQVLEGIVYMELRRRGYQVAVGKVGQKEVDFIATKDTTTEYYQVTYLCSDDATREREFSSLEAIDDNYPKTMLSLDAFPYSRNGVLGKNIVDWLLGD